MSQLPSVVVKPATPNPGSTPEVQPKRKPSMVRQLSLSSKEKLQELVQEHVRYPEITLSRFGSGTKSAT